MKILATAFWLLLFTTANGQTDSTWNPPKIWDDGNNKFKMTVNCIQSYLATPHTVKQFEKTLGHFMREWYSSDTTKYEDSTVGTKIRTPYYNHGKPNFDDPDWSFKRDELVITYTPKFKIIEISFVLEENEIRVEKFKLFLQQVKAAGYKTDLVYTRINNALARNDRRHFFVHPKTNVSIGIYLIAKDRYSIRFSKG